MEVKFVQCTPNPEENMAYIARVSNPNNQDNPSFEGLLKYCIKHEHWSVFEQAFMTLEINTTRAIAAQVLRHRSFTFQEFSQRYADANLLKTVELPELRRQDTKNRQNSIDDLDDNIVRAFNQRIRMLYAEAQELYDDMLDHGIAKECARKVLPLNSPSRLYMHGTLRSWIHYTDLRGSNGTQKEHMDIAHEIRDIFNEQFPCIAEAINSCKDF